MSKELFTQGEWVVTYQRNNIFILSGINNSDAGYIVSEIRNINEKDKSNANLIAAAPDMFEELENLVGILQSIHEDPSVLNVYKCHYDKHDIESALKALAKARGEG